MDIRAWLRNPLALIGASVAAAAPLHAQEIGAQAAATGVWSHRIPLSLVPAAAANLPNGKVLLWSGSSRLSFTTYGRGLTYTSVFDPATATATEHLVNQTGHEMFCPGTSNLPDGTVLVNGGSDSAETSLYKPSTGTWSVAARMNIPRAYQGNTVLQDGSVLTLGGSWAGGLGGKHGERWTAAGGWARLSGVPVTPALPPSDPEGIYRADNHMWLFAAPDGRVLQAGPSARMNWIGTRGSGSITPAGTRGDDAYSQTGIAVMYDTGKILKVGGAPGYENLPATTRAYVIDVNGRLSVSKLAPAAYARAYANAVVLPNGQVVVIGGQTIGKVFSDDNSVLAPELWDPTTRRFTVLPPIAVGRNYHSVALLLPDARVLSGGGGLCWSSCTVNHTDVQIFTPPYLFNADGTPATRPSIVSAPATATHGTQISVRTNSTVASFALVRLSSVTHSVNNDQRRIPLSFTADPALSNTYRLWIPGNPGITLPGYYMLFAMNASGVPSVAKTMRITGAAAPKLVSPGPKSGTVGAPVVLAITATAYRGSLSYRASALPPGLAINATTGVISGSPSAAGTFSSTVSAVDASATTSTRVLWTIAR